MVDVIFFMTIITASTAFSANYSVDISGLTDQNYADSIDSFTIWFEVDEFAASNFTLGDAVPTNGSMGWEIAKNAVVNNTVYKVDVYDQDGLFFSNPNYLTNGNMFTFEYTGTINELSYISFGDAHRALTTYLSRPPLRCPTKSIVNVLAGFDCYKNCDRERSGLFLFYTPFFQNV